ncbi:type I-E CRISPR-associated protein Cse2/CasB [Streptomyces sp. NPDC059991]|uniref:type I-E CRISPR-associated protein Cse2/CasB n=1 Tax=Streptomyces sp. NPDC059991 TaxID=3347028 RepID=UPI0036C72BDA
MSSPDRSTGVPPAWHARLAEQLGAVRRDAGLAAACQRGRNLEPLDELKMTGPIVYVLEGDDHTPDQEHVPSWQREAVLGAVHHTLTLYACHQQSQTPSMHQRGITLGEAARRLQTAMPSKDGAYTRFRAARGADSLPELIGHLRGLVSLLRTYTIPLDYVALADALASWEQPQRRAWLRRRWGLDFTHTPKSTQITSTDAPPSA